jgi:hypothetical protein
VDRVDTAAAARRGKPRSTRATTFPGARIDGPAIVSEATGTTMIEPGWQGRIDALGNLILERVVDAARETALGTDADPVMLEVFNNLFMNIAEQMGATLQNTAYSVNIKERLDFSCALFDARGNLVANAPHVPVHLGSMSDAVRTVARLNEGRHRPGRRLHAERALQRRHAPAGCHRHHAGLRTRGATISSSGSAPAGTTRISAAKRPAQAPRIPPISTRKAS